MDTYSFAYNMPSDKVCDTFYSDFEAYVFLPTPSFRKGFHRFSNNYAGTKTGIGRNHTAPWYGTTARLRKACFPTGFSDSLTDSLRSQACAWAPESVCAVPPIAESKVLPTFLKDSQ